MSKRGSRVPKKLKADAILEALFEIRFSTVTEPEFLIVRLAEAGPWKSFAKARLPAYGIPENVRQIDPNLRYQPTFEMTEKSKQRSVRIGPSVISYHLRKPYVGWSEFSAEIREMIEKLFESSEVLVVSRLGLRYVNAFSPSLHGIGSIADLDLSVTVAGLEVKSNININFNSPAFAQTDTTVRIASAELFAPAPGIEASVLADIDVATKEGFEASSKHKIFDWLEQARNAKNVEFFCLLTTESIDRLEER